MPAQRGGERATSGGDRGEGGRRPACAAAAAAARRAAPLCRCQVGGMSTFDRAPAIKHKFEVRFMGMSTVGRYTEVHPLQGVSAGPGS